MKLHHFRRELLPGLLTLTVGAAVLGVILVFRGQFSHPQARVVGLVVLYVGVGLLLWAVTHLKTGFPGLVSPRLDNLLVSGPYRLVRHPVYLGNTVALIGAALTATSIYGLAAVFLLFLPVELLRARLEERALAKKFGPAWIKYASEVGFFLPWLGRYESTDGRPERYG